MIRFDIKWPSAVILSIGLLAPWAAWELVQAAEDDVHAWERINYPYVEVGEFKTQVNILVLNGEHLGGLRFDILISGRSRMPELFASEEINAKIVRENGSVSEPLNGNPMVSMGGAGSAGGLTWAMNAMFPWGMNRLSAAWISVEIGSETLWLELPYGFDRDPSQPRLLDLQAEAPRRPAAVPKENVVQWLNVYYDFGEIQNDWRLSLFQRNPGDARAEVVLYREDSAVGKSMFLWDLHEPRTGVRIIESDGGTVGGMCRELRLHSDGMRRSDIYRFSRNLTQGRSWGEIEIAVGKETYRRTVPSSVFSYFRGHSRVEL